MTTNSIPFTFGISPPPSPRHQAKSSMPIFYYGLVIVGTASIILALYNFMILRWCTNRHRHMSSSQQTPEIPISNIQTSEATNTQFLIKSFMYKKDQNVTQDQGLEYVHECPVCISTFEEGEEVRKLPRCKHTFHISCIDMWLHSHFDCPVCRVPVQVPHPRLDDVGDQSENSREVLLLGSNIAV